MKILLALIICSQVSNTCVPPIESTTTFTNQYDCLMFGYQQSMDMMREIGPEEINKYKMFIRFTCTPTNTI
jgi:hypothetical protein